MFFNFVFILSSGCFDRSPEIITGFFPISPSPHCAELKPEPTADGEPEPAATDEPLPVTATELRIASEPEPMTLDQVREPATELAKVDTAMNSRSAEGSSTHCTMAKGKLCSMDWDWETHYIAKPKVLGHPLLMKGLTTLVISMSTNLNV